MGAGEEHVDRVLSAEFWQFFELAVLGAVVGTVVVGVLLLVRRRGGRLVPMEAAAMWVKPVLVGGAWAGLASDALAAVPAAMIFACAFVVGLACGLTAVEPLLRFRDAVLGVFAVVATIAVVVVRLSTSPDILVLYLLYFGAFAVGIALGGIRRLVQPVTAIAVLGGVEVIDFLLSPFGPAGYPSLDVPVVAVAVGGAIVCGVLLRLRPDLVIHVAGASITILAVVLQFFLALESVHHPEAGIAPDWSVAIAWVAVLVGYGLMRAGFVAGGVRRIF